MNKYITTSLIMRSKYAYLLFDQYIKEESKDNNISIYPWQQQLIAGGWQDVIALTGRQVGKSSVVSFLALQEAFKNAHSYIPMVTGSLDQSLKNMRKVNHMWYKFTGIKPMGRVRLDLPNGSTIEAMPNNEETIRGSTANLIIIDEASRVPDALYHAVRPFRIRMKHGRLIALSTPNGKQGWFYDQWVNDNHWLKFGPYTWEDAGIPEEKIAIERASMPLDIFQQEYECRFLSTTNAVFRDQDLSSISDKDIQMLELKLHG